MATGSVAVGCSLLLASACAAGDPGGGLFGMAGMAESVRSSAEGDLGMPVFAAMSLGLDFLPFCAGGDPGGEEVGERDWPLAGAFGMALGVRRRRLFAEQRVVDFYTETEPKCATEA